MDKEIENPVILSGYDGFVTKQLFNMVYMDEFTLDICRLLEENKIERTEKYSIVFDYRNRNPLNHSARMVRL